MLILLQTIDNFLSRPNIIPTEIAIIVLFWCMLGIANNYMYNLKPEPIKKLIGIEPIPTIIYIEVVLCITIPKVCYDYTCKETSLIYSFINSVSIAVITLLFGYLIKNILIMRRRKYDYVFYSEKEEKFYVFYHSNMMDFLQSILDGIDIERESNELLSVMLTFIHIFKVPAKQCFVPLEDIRNVIAMLKASNSAYENEVIEVEDTDEEECVLFQKYVYLNILVKLLEENLSSNQPLVCIRLRNLKKLRKPIRNIQLKG